MAFSWEQQIYPAGSQNVSVSIAYLDKSYIYVYLDGVLTTDYTWASDVTIRLDTALASSTEVLIVRRTNKEYLFILFASGAPFISENLDTQNTQFLHLAQEMVEGRSIEGFYGNISMNDFKITNLGDGTEPGDAVNKGQLDEVDNRVVALEQTFIVPTSSYPWFTNTTEETDVLTPGFTFTKAAVYINGVCQTLGYSYEVVDNTIMLADPVPAGTHVMARLGEDVPNEQGYATVTQMSNTNSRVTSLETGLVATNNDLSMLSSEVDQDLAALQVVTGRVDSAETNISQVTSRVDSLEQTKANNGVNSDITQLTNLTGGIKGTVSGTDVTNGYIGQVIGGTVGSAVTLTSGTAVNLHNITVTAGEWLVSGSVQYSNSTALTTTSRSQGISTTSAGLSNNWWDTDVTRAPVTALSAGTSAFHLPSRVIRVTSNTTIYVVVNLAFSPGAVTATGYIRAQRIR